MRVQLSIAALLFGLSMVQGTATASPADPPAKAAEEETLSQRQQSLLLQLSDAEANIKALNLALLRTGYKVGLAYDRVETNQKGNELMDRKGGGPVGWQDFYGKTARSFVMHDYGSPVYHQLQRPGQFNYIYKANNDQIARAKEQVASLAQDQATLLARRQKHEADQSRLWAELAWERVKDREIADEPLCRFKLRSTSKSDSRPQVLRAVVLFLRSADKVAADGLDSIEADQDATFADLNPRMKAAYAALRVSLADGMLATDLNDETKKRAEAIKTLCKQLSEECSIIVDNYRNALDRDKAKEDNSKLVFRGKLQESLAMFASAVGELDVQVTDSAKAWNIEPDKNAPTTDAVPAGAGPGLARNNGSAGGDALINASPETILKTGRPGEIAGDGEWTEWAPLVDGGKFGSNERTKRVFTWRTIPPTLVGRTWKTAKTKPATTLIVSEDGVVILAGFPGWLDKLAPGVRISNRTRLLRKGWTEVAQVKDSRDSELIVFVRVCKKGETFGFSNAVGMPFLIK